MLFSDNILIVFDCRLLECIEKWYYTSSQNGQFVILNQMQGVLEIVCHL